MAGSVQQVTSMENKMADDATPKKARLTDMLGHAGTERAGFGKLLPCRMCGGKPYAYDMRNTDTHQLCTVECGACDNEVLADCPEDAAFLWNSRV